MTANVSAKSWQFDPRRADTAARVRAEIRAAFELLQRADAVVRFDMIYAEVVSNLIRHAPGTIEMVVECVDEGGDLTVHVMDRGPGYCVNSHLPVDLFSETGRGLFIISLYADAFVVEDRAGGGSHARILLKPRSEG